jgi:ABC-2 type transport system ATP-binding protein
VFDLLTVEENLDYFSTAYGASRGHTSVDDRRRWLAKWLRFEQYSGTLVSQLSTGTKQKINLAVALLHDPDVLILDEPYSGFDWETYVLFWDYVVDARSKGKTIIIVSHLIYDESKFDQLLTLKNGILMKDGVQGCERPT